MWDWRHLVAADLPPAPTPTDNTQFYLVFAGAVVAALASVVIAFINRGGRTSASPPAPAGGAGDSRLGERVAVNESKLIGTERALDDLEDNFDMLDRRHAKSETRLDKLESRMDRLERWREESGDAR